MCQVFPDKDLSKCRTTVDRSQSYSPCGRPQALRQAPPILTAGSFTANCLKLMQLLARAGALALMLVFGQYILVGNGLGCLASHPDSTAPTSSALTISVHAAPEHAADCGDAQRGSSCALDSIACTAMALCGSVVMTAAAPQAVASLGLTRELTTVWFGSGTTHSIAPEPPPPRA